MRHSSIANPVRGTHANVLLLLQTIATLAACVRMDSVEKNSIALVLQEHASIHIILNFIHENFTGIKIQRS